MDKENCTLASQQSFDGPISRINTKELDCFKNSINLQKIDQLRNTLENQDIPHTCETINQAVEDLCNIFRESADIVKANRMPKKSFNETDGQTVVRRSV